MIVSLPAGAVTVLGDRIVIGNASFFPSAVLGDPADPDAVYIAGPAALYAKQTEVAPAWSVCLERQPETEDWVGWYCAPLDPSLRPGELTVCFRVTVDVTGMSKKEAVDRVAMVMGRPVRRWWPLRRWLAR